MEDCSISTTGTNYGFVGTSTFAKRTGNYDSGVPEGEVAEVSSEIFYVDSGGGGADSVPNQWGFVLPKIETTDATQTVILTFPAIADKAYAIWGWLVARRTDADGENEVFSVGTQLVYRNTAGGPVLIGDPVAWTSDANQGAPGLAVDFSIVANDIVARVTGIGGKTFEWLGIVNILEVRG